MMKALILVSIVGLVSGCTSAPTTYKTIRTGTDRYVVTGPDPNQLQAEAFQTCKSDQYEDYSVVQSNKYTLHFKCEKTPKPFFLQATESLDYAWDSLRTRVENWRAPSDKKE